MKRVLCSLIAALLAGTAVPSVLGAERLYVDSQTVREAQRTLNQHGHRLAVDGQMGPRTQAALREFQKSHNLEPTGRLNRQTLAALGLQEGGAAQRYSRETIRKVQETLNHRGYRAGEANGEMTEQTRTALREFQKSENLNATGQLNPGTLAALGLGDGASAAAGATQPQAATVRQIQERLNKRGHKAGPVDGKLGPATRAALRDFQRKENLPVTGQPDQRTLSALGVGGKSAGR